ncbi:hypothetical protein KY306_02050 [Candidatus Woesearchaeota archaeon]|nr:hypothetical protein [Candidatus Woesearchaeota archaeon]
MIPSFPTPSKMLLDFPNQLEKIIDLELSNLQSEEPAKHEQTGDIVFKLGKNIKNLSIEDLEKLREQVEALGLSKYEDNPNYEKIKPEPLIEPNHYFPENRGYLLFLLFRKASHHFSDAQQNGNVKIKAKKARCLLEIGKLSEKIHDANHTNPKRLFNQAIQIFSELEEKTQNFEDLSYYQFLKGDTQIRMADLNKDLGSYLDALTSLKKSYRSYERVIGNRILMQKDKENLSRNFARTGWAYFKIGKSIIELEEMGEDSARSLRKSLGTNNHTKFSFAMYCFNTAKEYLTKARAFGDNSVESKSKTGSCYFALAQLKFQRWLQLERLTLPEDILEKIPFPKKQLEQEIDKDLNNALAWYNLATRQDSGLLIPLYFKCLIASEFKDAPFKLSHSLFQNPDQPWEEFYYQVINSPMYLRWEMTRSDIGVVLDRHGLVEKSLVLKRSNHLERIIYQELEEFNKYIKYVLNCDEYLQLPKVIYSLPNLKVLALENGQKTLYEKVKIIAKDIKTNQDNIRKVIAQGKKPEYFRQKIRELKRKRTRLYFSAIQQMIRTDYGLYKVMPNILQRMELEHPEEARIIRLKTKQDYTKRFTNVVTTNNPFQTASFSSLESVMKKFSEKIAAMPHFIYSDCNPCNFSPFVIDKENIKEMAYLFDAAILLYHEGPDFTLKEIKRLFRQVIHERARVIDHQASYQTIPQEKKDQYSRDFDYVSVFRLFTLIGNEQEKINHRLKKMPEPKKTYWHNLLVKRQHLYLDYIKEIAEYAVSDRCSYHTKEDKQKFKELYQAIKNVKIARPNSRPSQSILLAAS